ncbi:MAG TPA: hypothetical protein QF401_07190, partial [Candidatus Poseidoniaceae archaeon]|nr:hypothetical protein [Candidatus Poseidoniaceae archaeon]
KRCLNVVGNGRVINGVDREGKATAENYATPQPAVVEPPFEPSYSHNRPNFERGENTFIEKLHRFVGM